LSLLGILSRQASAQQPAQQPAAGKLPAPAPSNMVMNPNFYANPFATRGQFNNTAVLGQNLQNAPIAAAPNGGLGYGMLAPGYNPALGYGSLSPSYASGLGGYGSLINSNNGNGGGGYGGGFGGGWGWGWGTQWMMNPFEGYLSGAASLTNANAQYQLTINQAKLLRQEAIRSAFQTRRAAIEQAEYERAHMPDPEKIRQEQLARELDRARVSPPLTEIWSGKSLNTLLRNAISQQSQGARGPHIALNEDTLKSINPTAGDTRGNIGLLKDNGNLQWPQPLTGELFKEAREDLSRRMKQAVQTVTAGNKSPDESTLADMQADLKRLNETVDASVSSLSLDQYTEAKRYLRQVGNAVTALRDRNVSNYFNDNWRLRGKSVAELVKFMADKGLWFAPATPGDEPAYLALYHALAAFDAGMPRVATTNGTGGER
jgi:hypothetical protein